jgi:NhaP-type Na+/H+ or K+/H+ antiporter
MTFLTVAPLTYIANKYELFSVTFGTDIEIMEDDYGKSHLKNAPAHRILSNVDENINSDDAEEKNLKNYELDENEKEDDKEEKKEQEKEEEKKNEEKKELKEEKAHILHFSIKEILLFASVISATDTVAALTFVKEESEPKLFAILFGEGVINDAVCIVLYGIIREFTSSNEEFTSKTPIKMVGSFLSMFFFSFLIGMLVGVISSLFLKKLKNFKLNRVQECSIIIFFAFISYTLTEELGLSPIIALLFTGIFMSHYTFYNLSFQAREESSIVSRIMANIAEAFVFTYLGLTVIYYTSIAFSFSFIFLELIFVILGRVIAIYGLSFIMSLLKVKNFNLKQSHKGIMSCAGSIRGAIAFGLAISIDTKDKVNKYP